MGRALAASLGHRFVDVDDDVLEPTWGCSVADRLRALGDDAFVREEGAALMRFAATDSVISLSGSNPLHAQSMEHVAKDAVVVYLDIDPVRERPAHTNCKYWRWLDWTRLLG